MKFFTADLHLQHEHILNFTTRPFTTVADHDESVIECINRHVGRNDELFILGDIAWYGFDKNWFHCKNLHLLWGNHDKARFGKEFKSANDALEIKISGDQKVFLSHYPHAYWPSAHHGSIHLYGHTHAQKEVELDAAWPQRRSLDVGLDNSLRFFYQMRPFSEEDILKIMSKRAGHDDIKKQIVQGLHN